MSSELEGGGYDPRIYIPQNRMGWWGDWDKRPRCVETDRVAIPDLATAERKAAAVRKREESGQAKPVPGKKMIPHFCRHCGQYHIAHRKVRPT